MFFSVIIPVYNVEPYLARAVDSILKQDYSGEFEIILIDDGSTDKSGSICDDYAQRDARIRVVHKENGGVSSARNAGMKSAVGEYIVFLDSDDWLDADALARFESALTKNAVDVCVFLYKTADVSGVHLCERIKKCSKESALQIEEFLQTDNLGPGSWLQLYRRCFLLKNDICFPVGVVCAEDVLFTTRVSLFAADVVVLDYYGYNYFQREDSIMHTEQPEKVRKRLEDTLFIVFELRKLPNEFPLQSARYPAVWTNANMLLTVLFLKIISAQIPYQLAKQIYIKMLDEKLFYFTDISQTGIHSFYRTLIRLHCPLIVLRLINQCILKTSKLRH